MTTKFKDILLLLLAIVFSVALMFASVELPRLIDSFLQKDVGFPGFDQGEVNSMPIKPICLSKVYTCVGSVMVVCFSSPYLSFSVMPRG